MNFSTAPQECLKVFQDVWAWIQSIDQRVIGEPEFAEGLHRAEGRILRSEVGAADEDDVDAVPGALCDPGQIGERHSALSLEDRMDVSPPCGGGDVPLSDVANALGMAESGARDECDVAEGRSAETGHHGASRRAGALGFALEVVEFLAGDGRELFEVVRRVQAVFVDGVLPDEAVEEVAALRHAGARRDRGVALRVEQRVAVRVDGDIEPAGDEDLEPVVHAAGLPVLVGEAEAVHAAEDAGGIDADDLLELVVDFSEELAGVDDTHRTLFEAVMFPQRGHCTDVHAGDERGTEIDGHTVRPPVSQRLHNTVARHWQVHYFLSATPAAF